MAQSKAKSVKEYLAELPADRRNALYAVRKVILDNLPKDYVESMQYGMISYIIPLERYPHTYNKLPLVIASLASQKSYMALYLMCIYSDKESEKSFIEKYKASGKKLDMGKSCVRFKKLEDLPLGLIGETIAGAPVNKFITIYEKSRNKLN
jgi:hypothetical protein